jgi:hypothetical protein
MCGIHKQYYGYYPTLNEGLAKCLWPMMRLGARKSPCTEGQIGCNWLLVLGVVGAEAEVVMIEDRVGWEWSGGAAAEGANGDADRSGCHTQACFV